MIKEAYCSYEISKLLKEKGFNVPCNSWYMPCSDGSVKKFMLTRPDNYNHYDGFPWTVSRPTHQMAMAWLREVYNIFIEISTSIDLNGDYHFSYTILDKECKYVRKGYTDFDWNYEEAVEAALKYSLENLI